MLDDEFEVPWQITALILAAESMVEEALAIALWSNRFFESCYKTVKRADSCKRRSVNLETSHEARASARLRLN